jgi:heptosyltransferase-1
VTAGEAEDSRHLQAAFHPMSDILFIKTSSLGDVIHNMAAVTEARRRVAGARIAWIVEEAFAPLVRLHPAVDETIAVASRRWRRTPLDPSTWRELAAFTRAVRSRRYDTVIDSQGLFRSALIARIARGVRHGYDAGSIRERAASWLYDVRHKVERDQHAIARNRALAGLALGYAPHGAIDYGLDRSRFAGDAAGRVAVLLHATARPEKEWPVPNWIEVARALLARGYEPVLPWGTPAERARSEAIAAAVPQARVPERRPLDDVARLIASAALVVGVDTGLMHVAAAFGVPLVAIFVGTAPGLYGPMGVGPIGIVGGEAGTPVIAEVLAAVDRVAVATA